MNKTEVINTMAMLLAIKELTELQGATIKVPEKALFGRAEYFRAELSRGRTVDSLENEFVSRGNHEGN